MSNSGPGISFVGHRSYRPSVIELGIVTAAVSIAVCAAFPGAVLAVVLGIIVLVLSALRVDALLYLAIFLLPIAPTLPSEMMILRDVSALLHLAMFAGVWLGYMIRGESVRTWLLGARLNYLIAAYVGIVTLSVLIPGHTTITAEKSLFRWVSYFCLYLAVTGWVKSKQQIKNILGILGASTLLGVLAVHLLGGSVTYALPISTGSTLYVAATDLMPEVNREKGVRMAFVVFAGMGLFLLAKTLADF